VGGRRDLRPRGNVHPGLALAIGACARVGCGIWRAAPRKVRAVAGPRQVRLGPEMAPDTPPRSSRPGEPGDAPRSQRGAEHARVIEPSAAPRREPIHFRGLGVARWTTRAPASLGHRPARDRVRPSSLVPIREHEVASAARRRPRAARSSCTSPWPNEIVADFKMPAHVRQRRIRPRPRARAPGALHRRARAAVQARPRAWVPWISDHAVGEGGRLEMQGRRRLGDEQYRGAAAAPGRRARGARCWAPGREWASSRLRHARLRTSGSAT